MSDIRADMPRFHVFLHVEFVLTMDFRFVGRLGFLSFSVEGTLRGVILVMWYLPRLTAEGLNGAHYGGGDSDGDDGAGGGPVEPSRPPTPREAGGRDRRGNVAPSRLCVHQYGCGQ